MNFLGKISRTLSKPEESLTGALHGRKGWCASGRRIQKFSGLGFRVYCVFDRFWDGDVIWVLGFRQRLVFLFGFASITERILSSSVS